MKGWKKGWSDTAKENTLEVTRGKSWRNGFKRMSLTAEIEKV